MDCREGTTFDKDGYARIQRKSASRTAWIEAYGEPPEGYHVHHLCGNRACYLVAHLIAVSPKDHRKLHPDNAPPIKMRKTHCGKGHLYSEKLDSVGQQQCLVCRAAAARRAYQRRT